ALTRADLHHARQAATAAAVPLVLDATRLLENCVAIADDEGPNPGDPWAVAHELLSLADIATFSLSKDWGVNFGGLVVSRLPALDERLLQEVELRGVEVGVTGRRVLQTALTDRDWALTHVRQRMAAVRALWQPLQTRGAPVPAWVGGHCTLIDTARIPRFAGQPVEAFLDWVHEETQIRGGRHLAGDAYPTRQSCARFAVPVGMTVAAAAAAGARLAALFDAPAPLPGWFAEQLSQLGSTLAGDKYAPSDQNLEVIRELVPSATCEMVQLPEGVAEVFTVGQGQPLVLMQPFNIGAGIFAAQMAKLAHRFRIIVVHQPGVGRTRVKGNLSLEGIVTFQLRVLEKLGVEGPYHLAGASVGAIFAQYFAIRFPTRTRSLALLGGSYRFANRKGQIDRLEQVIAEDFEAIQAGSGSVRAAAEREHITRFLLRCESMDPQTGLRYLDLFSKEPELAPRLGEITAPTLIVQGRCDSVVGVKTGHFLHGAIPNSSYLELPESGHFVCVTDTDAVNQALAEHLRRNGSQS
ncbi:MAG TPA: alpha/beta fold hydrolase, partial [Kofleriaceae bacterium]|nr:alpha/beta fold hydrolase [Kofleriaceae bacterium]